MCCFLKLMILCHSCHKQFQCWTLNRFLIDIATWVPHDVKFNCNGKIINDDDNDQERNSMVLSTLTNNEQNYKTFNGMREEMDDFIMMNSPWF